MVPIYEIRKYSCTRVLLVLLLVYRHFGDGATFEWTCGQKSNAKVVAWRRIPSGLVAKVKMAKMTEI